MTKSDLIKVIVEKFPEVNKRQLEFIVNGVFGVIKSSLSAGDKVEIRGFGSFRIKTKDPRTARNPKTGEMVEVGEIRVPRFHPGKELKSKLTENS